MGVLDDIIASLQVKHVAPAALTGVMPAPEVTPTMTYGAPPILAPVATKPEDDWAPPAPTMIAPPVTPLGALAAVPGSRSPIMGGVLGR